MVINDIIREALPSYFSYIFATYKEADYEVDKCKDFPICLHVAQISGTFNIDKLATLTDSQEVVLVLLDKDKKGSADSDHSGVIIERMKQEAVKMIGELNRGGQVEPISGQVKYSPVVKDFNKCLTGIAIQLTLRPNDAVCL